MVEKQSKDIYSYGIACVFLSSFLAIFFGVGTHLIYNNTGKDSYIAIIIGSVLSVGILYIFKYIFNNNFKDDIYKLNEALFGKVGKILNFIMFVAFFLICSAVLYSVSNFLNVEYLPETNINLIKSLILVSLIYISSKKLPDIIRTNQIFSIISVIIMALNIIGVYQEFNIENLKPVFSESKINMLKSVLVYVVLSIVPFTMLLITSKNRIKDAKNVNSIIYKVVLFTNIIQVILTFVTILVLGEELISAFRFPEYILLKQFNLFNMLERVENVLSLQFYFNSFSLLSLLYYFMINFLPNTRVKKTYPTIISIVLFFCTSNFFRNTVAFVERINSYSFYVILIGLLIPILLTFIKLKKYSKKV